MIFSEAMREAILAGAKTQTRRKILNVPDPTVVRGRTIVRRPFRPVKGRLYAVQAKRGGSTLFRIHCTDVDRQILGDITYDDVRAEGFPRLAAFESYWMRLHDSGWPRIEQVPCPDCLGDPDHPSDELEPCTTCRGGEAWVPFEPTPTEDEIHQRFNARHRDTPVWVITFEPDVTSIPRYLAERTDRAELDYVTGSGQAMIEASPHGNRTDVPEAIEAVDPAYLDRLAGRAATDHQLRYDQARDLDRQLLSREQRVADAQRAAKANNVNLSSELRAFDRLKRANAPQDRLDRQADAIALKARPRPRGTDLEAA